MFQSKDVTPKHKYCRSCLKEIRNNVSRTHHLMEPPEPVIQLKNGRKASTYLQCYYYCIRKGGTDHFNVDSLMDYAYICTRCRFQLMRTIDFIVKSQRNEDFLMSMYEKSTHDGNAAEEFDEEDEMVNDNKYGDNTTTIDLEYELFGGTTNSGEEEFEDNKSQQSKGDNEDEEEETDLLVECLDPNDETMLDFKNSTDIDSELDINEMINDISKEAEYQQEIALESTTKNNDTNNKKPLKKTKNLIVDFEEVLIETETEKTSSKRSKSSKKVLTETVIEETSSKKSNPSKQARNSITTKDKNQGKRHKEKYFNFKCEICFKVYRLERELFEHYNEHDVNSLEYPCDNCQCCFMSQDRLNFHKNVVHKNIQYEDCEKCGKLISPGCLLVHMEEAHSNETKYECKTCDRCFLTKLAFAKHQTTIHGSSKLSRYECSQCDRFFFTAKNLKKHIQADHNNKTHQQQNNDKSGKEYLCDMCSETFTTKTNLRMHLQRHKGKVLKCSYCEKEFVTTKDLRIHMRFHTREFPFKCDRCSRTFAIKTHLDHHHKQRHEGVRYKCQMCDKEFGHSFSLRQHSFKHRGYPYSCKLCNRGWPSMFKTRVHLKAMHGDAFNGVEYSDELADQYIVRNNIEKMYARVEVDADGIMLR
ncbi:uncharacterized protein [Musca autumnalis]|uniref:uncharacterized protein n=1 Tax=Musca autumnalis TaxID=221902 RepID=UPI003CF247B8